MKPSVEPLVRAEAVQRRRMIAALAAGTFVFMLALSGTYEAVGGASGFASAFGQEMPSFFSAFTGTAGADFFSPANFLGFGFVHPLFLVLTLTIAISIGTAAVAGDIESGRAEMLYTRPLPRTAVLDARVGLWALAELVVVGGAVLGAFVGSRLSPDLRDVGVAVILRIALQYLPLVTFFAAVAFAASVEAPTRGRALGVAVGVAALSYLVNFVSLIWHPLAFARHLGPFGYYAPLEAIDGNEPLDAAVLLVAATALFLVARHRLLHRDLVS